MLNALPELLQNMYSLWHKRLPTIFKCRVQMQIYS